MGQKGSKMDTRRGQEGAREAQLGPKMVQVGQRWSRKWARWAPRGVRKVQERPKLAPRAARKKGTPNFMIFGPIWGPVLEAVSGSGRSFEALW